MNRGLLWSLLLSWFLSCLVCSKKTAKEWSKVSFDDVDDDDEADSRQEKHDIIKVTFGSAYSAHDRAVISEKFYEQLLSAGVKIQLFEGGQQHPNTMLLATTKREQVWDYFLLHIAEFPAVMRVNMDDAVLGGEIWNIPQYQKEFDADNLRQAEEQKLQDEKQQHLLEEIRERMDL